MIRLARDPRFATRVGEAVDQLLASDRPVFHGIALVVMAHHPTLAIRGRRPLRDLDVTTLRRFTRVAPTVLDARPIDVLTHLGELWQRDDPMTRQAVLEALERLAPRAPGPVGAFLRQHGRLSFFIAKRPEAITTNRALPRTLAAVGRADPAFARSALLRVIKEVSRRNAGRDQVIFLLDLLAAEWPNLGDGLFLEKITNTVRHAQSQHRDRDSRPVRHALGRVLAAEWARLHPAILTSAAGDANRNAWRGLVDAVCEEVEADDQDPRAGAGLFGIALILQRLPTEHWAIAETLGRLLALRPPNAPYQLARGPLSVLLESAGPASDAAWSVVAGLLSGLPAPGNRAAPGPQLWAAVARSAVNDAALAPEQLAARLSDIPAAADVHTWLRDDGLLQLLVPAAVGGHPVARKALKALGTTPENTSPNARRIVRHTLREHTGRASDLAKLLVRLCAVDGEVAPIGGVVTQAAGSAHDPTIRRLRSELRGLAPAILLQLDELAGGTPEQQRDAAGLWLKLDEIDSPAVPAADRLLTLAATVPDRRARINLLRLIGRRAARGVIPVRDTTALLAQHVGLDGDPPRLIDPRAPDRAGDASVLDAARTAWIQVLLGAEDFDSAKARRVLGLASATPTDAGVFTLVGKAVRRLAEQGDVETATRLLLDLSAEAERVELTLNSYEGLANRIRGDVRALLRRASQEQVDVLLRRVVELPAVLGRIIVSSAARECFETAEKALRDLVNQPLPHGVGKQIETELRARARTVGSHPMPQFLHSIEKERDYPGLYRAPL
ncbi:hypothetical protein ACIBO1_30485 [Micromonospora sp. NPDC049903]|uniref:hypothetical protein n=1 Tax=Micromonospora sp. NPDC049903 TaxID=3364276 RepID=UPI0037B6917F